MKIVFWISILLVAYTYAGYPILLWVWNRFRPPRGALSEVRPTVSVIVAARNEADKIRGKIENTLALEYSADRLEVIVASDASDDATDEIVREYAPRGVHLVRASQRRGKEYAQGLAIADAKGEVLVFSDAATMLEPDALNWLVQNFADPSIGAVSTEDVLVDVGKTVAAEGLYVRYEMWVRRLESCFHSLVGLSGSCFAMRRELCLDWSSTLASDFMAAIRAARRGYRSVADPSARAKFVAVSSPQVEMARKIRTFLRGITVLLANLDMLNPLRFGRFAFQLVSHKVFRFLAPFLLLTTLAASGVLLGEQLFRVFFWTQIGFYTLGIGSGLFTVLQRFWANRVAYYFTMVQWTILVAWWRYIRGNHQVAWEPSKRPEFVAGDRG